MKMIPASATVTLNDIAMHKKRNGERIYNFAAGDPVLKNHSLITNAALKKSANGYLPYPPVEGLPELRQLAAAWMNTNYKTSYSKENILITNGGKFALFALAYCLIQPNEEVLIPAPYWVSYPSIVAMAGGTPKIIPTDPKNGWKMTGIDLQNQITEKSKFLIFNNACNPTGIIYTQSEINEILTIAKHAGIKVISDEVYSDLVYDNHIFVSCGTFAEHRENTFIVQSFSKNFGMTGWRIGFIAGAESVIRRLAAFQGQTTTGTALMSQWAAMGALENAAVVTAYVKQAMKQRRDLFVKTYNSLFSESLQSPASGIYAFVPVSAFGVHGKVDTNALCTDIINFGNVALIPGTAFGQEGYVRFSFSESEEEIHQGLHALKNTVALLRNRKGK